MLWCTSLLSCIGVATTPYQRRLPAADEKAITENTLRRSEEVSELWGPSPNACIYVIASAGHRKFGVSGAKTLQGAEYWDEDCQRESGSSQG